MLVALAGLPGTGKIPSAAALRDAPGAVVLNKDEVRAVLFPRPVLDYSAEQNDIAMRAIYGAAAASFRPIPLKPFSLMAALSGAAIKCATSSP